MNSQDKTDELVKSALDGTLEPLSDLSRARIGTNVLGAIAESHRTNTAEVQVLVRRRLARGSLLLIGAASCVALGWWFGSSHENESLLLADTGNPTESTANSSSVTVTSTGQDQQSKDLALEKAPQHKDSAVASSQALRVVRAQAGEQVEVRVGDAELTLFGPGDLTIAAASAVDGPQVVRVNQGTVVSKANGESIVLTNGNANQTFKGAMVAIRVERGTIVASASSERLVKRVFSVEFEDHQRLRTAAIDDQTKVAPKQSPPSTADSAIGVRPKIQQDPEQSLEKIVEEQAETDAEIEDAKIAEAAAIYVEAEQAMKRGKLSVAVELLERIIMLSPKSPDAVVAAFDLALLAHRAGNFGEAIKRLDALLNASLNDQASGPVYDAARLLRCRARESKVGRDESACLKNRP